LSRITVKVSYKYIIALRDAFIQKSVLLYAVILGYYFDKAKMPECLAMYMEWVTQESPAKSQSGNRGYHICKL